MIFLILQEITLPLSNPVLKFLLILVIILIAPLLLNKIKVPALLGLIIAGAIIGPNGFNLMERDSGIILSGTAGLLYIMFLAGLEIDLKDFKDNRNKSMVFGMYTFLIPMGLGILTGLYILEFSMLTSVLLASMFASHTLIAYPIVSKLGVTKNRAVNITIGGTMITDTLALLVLAVIVGMAHGEVNVLFWTRLSISILLCGLIIVFLFPIIAKWFFKNFNDNVSQYIFVLVLVFSGAFLAELAGIEAIIGAFLTGLSINRLIPHSSPLMNRIEFVGNAIFIPFFLIGVGMLINYKIFFMNFETIKVGAVMVVVATSAKFIAAWLTQKSFKFTTDERRIIFGLSNAQAAATLAAVLIGYNIIIGTTASGEDIRLLNETVLNGTILMILVTCTIASFEAQAGAKNIALAGGASNGFSRLNTDEKILIPVSNAENTEELIQLALSLKSKVNTRGLYALSIVNNNLEPAIAENNSNRLLDIASKTASATDNHLKKLIRYDLNILNGITSVLKEQKITDLILGLHIKKDISDSFLGSLTESILSRSGSTTFIYKPRQPLGTIKRHLIFIPENAEKEIGFINWVLKIWNLAENTGAQLVFYANDKTLKILEEINSKHSINCEFKSASIWDEFISSEFKTREDDNLIIILSRKNKPSFHEKMQKLPSYLNERFQENGFILVYPIQSGVENSSVSDLFNPSLYDSVGKLEELGKIFSKNWNRS
ncbi:cation:proton antiporter [Christiangramia salexigens]|uniref:Sodium:proton antiporter n=1 Tax=Christiangramia salexigens TaxID=1913577 RepID=A0A1L3J460_9FLAO|nr:cation:proton antiporter [Christiangramia salexigens]APG59918.1 sodium:proton antiporter [Christiangramia salexigens]